MELKKVPAEKWRCSGADRGNKHPHPPPTNYVYVTRFSHPGQSTSWIMQGGTVQRWQMLLILVEAKPQWNLATATVSAAASLKPCALRTLLCPLMTNDPNTINIFVCVNAMLLRRVYAPDAARCSWNWKNELLLPDQLHIDMMGIYIYIYNSADADMRRH